MSKRTREPTDEEEDCCPICCDVPRPPAGQLKCGHSYCFLCIYKWSKQSNICPYCRRRYTGIKKISSAGKVLSTVRVRKKDFEHEQDVDSDDYASSDEDGGYHACRICGTDDDCEVLFLCDYPGCDNQQHAYCCQPCVEEPPADGEFFCSECQEQHGLPCQWTTADRKLNPQGWTGLGATEAVMAAAEAAGADEAADIEAAGPGPAAVVEVADSPAELFPSLELPSQASDGEEDGAGTSAPPAPAPPPRAAPPVEYNRPATQPLDPSRRFVPPFIPEPLEGDLPELPSNPHAQDGLMHMIYHPPDRKVSLVEAEETKHRYANMATLQDSFQASIRQRAPRRAPQRARPHSAPGPRRLTAVSASDDVADLEALAKPSQSQQPRQMSLSEATAMLRSRSSLGATQTDPTQTEEEATQAEPEELTTAGIEKMQEMLRKLRLEMQSERARTPAPARAEPPAGADRKKRRRGRSNAQIYAARSLVAASLCAALAGVAVADSAREGRLQRRAAAAAVPGSLVHGVHVTTAARNVVIKAVKQELLPAYKVGRLSKDAFKAVAKGVVDALVDGAVKRHRAALRGVRDATQQLIDIFLSAEEYRRLEALCRDRVNDIS